MISQEKNDNHTDHAHDPVASEPPALAVAATLTTDEPDVDMPFFQRQAADRLPPPPIAFSNEPSTLGLNDTLDCAAAMLRRIFDSPAVRLAYYNRSRSWHKNSAGKGKDGGDFERQWLKMFAEEIPGGKGANLNMNDFGNIHRVMFLTLRRAMLAITGHDVHPNPNEPPPPAGTVFRSFHWIPNDTSTPQGTYNPPELGFPLDQP